MQTPYQSPRPEPTTKAGEVLLSANHIALLHGLCDRPNGEAQSTADLVRAALPYITFFRRLPSYWTLREGSRTLHSAWVSRQRIGRRIAWRLTVRGRDILEGGVPARLRGLGPYDGLASLREKTKQERQQMALEARWAGAKRDKVLAPLVASADQLIETWCARNAPCGFNAALRYQHSKKELARFVHSFVLRHRALPLGTHDVSLGRSSVPVIVDFDELRGSVSAPDVLLEDHGSVVLIRPRAPEAEARLRGLVDEDAQWWGGALVCEPRYVAEILEGLARGDA